jgi:hypothetical protein
VSETALKALPRNILKESVTDNTGKRTIKIRDLEHYRHITANLTEDFTISDNGKLYKIDGNFAEKV